MCGTLVLLPTLQQSSCRLTNPARTLSTIMAIILQEAQHKPSFDAPFEAAVDNTLAEAVIAKTFRRSND
jgi:hypothetical protein